jgi:hypothetical protein
MLLGGSLSSSQLIVESIKTAAARSSPIDGDALLREVEVVIEGVPKPGRGKQDQKRWADDNVRLLASIYRRYTAREIGFTNCEAETRFERFVRLVIVTEGQKVSRNLVKAAIRRFNQSETRNRDSANAIAAE